MKIEQNVLDWLLEDENPSIKYRTLTELLDFNHEDKSAKQAKAAIVSSQTVKKIMSIMHPDGYWMYLGKGDTIQYGMSASTHFVLAYLSELGLDKDNKSVSLAVERYLNLNPSDFHLNMSCLYAHNLRTFIRLGYKDDPRVKSRIQVLLNDKRFDGGYLCDQKTRNARTKSCIRGSIKALNAFTSIPELWNDERCKQVVKYFLDRRVFFRQTKPEEIIRDELLQVRFPFVATGTLLEPVYALSVMGNGEDERMLEAWKKLSEKKDDCGKYISDGHTNTLFKPDKKGQQSKWVTLYALLAIKNKSQAKSFEKHSEVP